MKAMMKIRALLGGIALMLTASTNADWTAYAKTDDGVRHVDVDTYQKTNAGFRVWEMVNLHRPERTPSGQIAKSFRILNEYDCEQARMRFLTLFEYPMADAEGSVIYSESGPGNWLHAIPGSAGDMIIKMGCPKESDKSPMKMRSAR